MAEQPIDLLRAWLQQQLAPEQQRWLEERMETLAAERSERALHVALGMIPRKLPKTDLALDEDDLRAARAARRDWDPVGLSLADAARILVLLGADISNLSFSERFRELCRTAEVSELIAFYRGLPLYPDPKELVWQAGEGLRTNMRSVFEAIAHRNPFPREAFDEKTWNQMVLKALFVGSTLHPILGLDERANPELAAILCDYAHERWAAGRKVSPELWRCVGPFAEGAMVDDLKRAFQEGDPVEREAAALALAASPDPAARARLKDDPDLARRIDEGVLGWSSL